ncbi:hypothetical protein BC828DRAFT_385072 [Blastocladiella britannica]|nr:hypothetical protein BC828DRAFT_385072 [Blastocladiella britannica]
MATITVSGEIIIGLHACGIALLSRTGYIIAAAIHKSSHRSYWLTALVAVLALAAAAGTEIAYGLVTVQDGPSRLIWTPYDTLVGDISARIGLAAMTACKLWRYGMIAGHSQQKLVNYTNAAVIVAILASMSVTMNLRIVTAAFLLDGKNADLSRSYTSWGQVERILTFCVFLGIQFINLLADFGFFQEVTRHVATAVVHQESVVSLRSPNTMSRVRYLIIIPSTLIVAAYATMVTWTQVLSWYPTSPTLSLMKAYSLTLQRFCPTVETAIFILITVPQTRSLIHVQGGPEISGRFENATIAPGSNNEATIEGSTGSWSQSHDNGVEVQFSPDEKGKIFAPTEGLSAAAIPAAKSVFSSFARTSHIVSGGGSHSSHPRTPGNPISVHNMVSFIAGLSPEAVMAPPEAASGD